MSFLFRNGSAGSALGAVVVAALLAGCQRESRHFHVLGPASNTADARPMSSLRPGPVVPGEPVKNPAVPNPYPNAYDTNAWEIAQGQRLFTWMNCTGCHAHGGGAIGPPLMDAEWRYGAEPENIYASIVEGRPNGMPAFRGKLTNHQVWQLVAYVRSLSGHVRKDAAPGRVDGMHVKQRELAKETEPIVQEKKP